MEEILLSEKLEGKAANLMTVHIKWLGHASFQVKANGKSIYIDLEKKSPTYEKADLVLVTHSHYDHCDPSQIKKVRKDNTTVIAPRDCSTKISGDVKTLKPGEEAKIGGVKIKAVEAYNNKRFRSPGNPYHPKGLGVGYLIEIEDTIIYHAGDTDFIPEMEELGHVNVALLPSGDTYTMDNVDAAEAALRIKPEAVIPMHRWDTDPKEFKKRVAANSKIRVVLLQEGEEYQVN